MTASAGRVITKLGSRRRRGRRYYAPRGRSTSWPRRRYRAPRGRSTSWRRENPIETGWIPRRHRATGTTVSASARASEMAKTTARGTAISGAKKSTCPRVVQDLKSPCSESRAGARKRGKWTTALTRTTAAGSTRAGVHRERVVATPRRVSSSRYREQVAGRRRRGSCAGDKSAAPQVPVDCFRRAKHHGHGKLQ